VHQLNSDPAWQETKVTAGVHSIDKSRVGRNIGGFVSHSFSPRLPVLREDGVFLLLMSKFCSPVLPAFGHGQLYAISGQCLAL
jgi:hypothetical protein